MKKIITLITLTFLTTISARSQTWTSMASGLGSASDSVKAIAIDPNGNIYVGGSFTGAINYLAKWNGSSWVEVGPLNGPVYAIGIKTSNDIYFGGSFSTASGVAVNNIARLSGGGWTSPDSGFDGQVNSILIPGSGEVYAGGTFSNSGSTYVNHVAKLVGGNWTAMGAGIGGVVNTLTVPTGSSSPVYAGTNIVTNPVQKFDGTSWSALSGISGGNVYALAFYSGFLYAGGDFQQPNQSAAKWDVTNGWTSIITQFSFSQTVYALYTKPGSALFIGGNFTGIGVGSPNYIAKITDPIQPIQSFTISSEITGGSVHAINISSSRVIAGGRFASPATNIGITSGPISVEEISGLVLNKNLYPNPASGKVRLKISTSVNLKSPGLRIFDVQSKEVKVDIDIYNNNKETEFTFDCSSLTGGNYFYSITEDGKRIVSDQFIIE